MPLDRQTSAGDVESADVLVFTPRLEDKGACEQDLVDVQELSSSAALSRDTVNDLHPWVRAKFLELWDLAQVVDPF